MLRLFFDEGGGRKFVLAGGVVTFILVACTVLLCVGLIDGGQWLSALDRVLWLAGGYIFGNVAQKIGDAFGDRKTP